MNLDHLKKIEGFQHYFISQEGEIYYRTLYKLKKVKKQRYLKRNYCVLYRNNKAYRVAVARSVLKAFAPIEEQMWHIVYFKNKNSRDDRLENLYWGLQKVNKNCIKANLEYQRSRRREALPNLSFEEQMLISWKQEIKENNNLIRSITK